MTFPQGYDNHGERPGLWAIYRREHAERPVIISSAEGVDLLIDDIASGDVEHTLAQVFSLNRALLPSGFPDHELLVGAGRVPALGIISYAASGENWVTVGDGDGREDVAYFIDGQITEFQGNSEIPLDLVRAGVKDFLLSGGSRPTCVQWQVFGNWL